MLGRQKTTAICAMFSAFAIQGMDSAKAASSSVGVSMHFEVAPADLYRNLNVEPTKARSCEALKARIVTAWAGKKRGPVLTCSSQATMPLIVKEKSDGTLVVRP